MSKAMRTIEQQIKAAFDGLTRAERQLASHIMRNYPVAALGSITALAKGADVSTPTVVRLTQKLGYKGYPDFQSVVRCEVEERLVSPLTKHDRWAEGVPQTHMLNRFADAVMGNLQATLAQIDHAEFDAIAALMADPGRKVYATGGRITHALADYFVTHMNVSRSGVSMLSDRSSAWPPALIGRHLGQLQDAAFIAADVQHQKHVARHHLDQGALVVLITDQWVSPASAFAHHRLSAHVEAPSAWDSTVAIQLLLETLLAAVENQTWSETQSRMQRLEELYARSRFFRRGK